MPTGEVQSNKTKICIPVAWIIYSTIYSSSPQTMKCLSNFQSTDKLFFSPPKYVECKKHNQQSLFYTITMQYYDSLALSLTKYVITFKQKMQLIISKLKIEKCDVNPM